MHIHHSFFLVSVMSASLCGMHSSSHDASSNWQSLAKGDRALYFASAFASGFIAGSTTDSYPHHFYTAIDLACYPVLKLIKKKIKPHYPSDLERDALILGLKAPLHLAAAYTLNSTRKHIEKPDLLPFKLGILLQKPTPYEEPGFSGKEGINRVVQFVFSEAVKGFTHKAGMKYQYPKLKRSEPSLFSFNIIPAWLKRLYCSLIGPKDATPSPKSEKDSSYEKPIQIKVSTFAYYLGKWCGKILLRPSLQGLMDKTLTGLSYEENRDEMLDTPLKK